MKSDLQHAQLQLDGLTFPKWPTERIEGGSLAHVPSTSATVADTVANLDLKHFNPTASRKELLRADRRLERQRSVTSGDDTVLVMRVTKMLQDRAA